MTKQSVPMALTTALPVPAELFAAFFDMVAEHGLPSVSLQRLAAAHHWPLAALRQVYPTIGHIVARFSDYVTEQMQNNVPPDPDSTPREVLFELFMARLDVLQTYRDGFVRLLKEVPTRPDLVLILARQSQRAVQTIIDASSWSGSLWQRPAYQLALSGIGGRLLYAWRQDDTLDLSKTMAVLDTQLDRLNKFFQT